MQFRALAAITAAAHALVDHEPETDPDELVPRFFETAEARFWLDCVAEWDLPPAVREAHETLSAWLAEEHAAHAALVSGEDL